VEKSYLLKLVQELRGEGIKENDGGVNSTMIYCKNFCDYHNVALPRTKIIFLKKSDAGDFKVYCRAIVTKTA
jgi:hypothetical protein